MAALRGPGTDAMSFGVCGLRGHSQEVSPYHADRILGFRNNLYASVANEVLGFVLRGEDPKSGKIVTRSCVEP